MTKGVPRLRYRFASGGKSALSIPTSFRSQKQQPSICHPERSRGICSSPFPVRKRASTKRVRIHNAPAALSLLQIGQPLRGFGCQPFGLVVNPTKA
jgi:hypothetical protein